MGHALHNPYFVQKNFNLPAPGSAPRSVRGGSTPSIALENINTGGNTGGTTGDTIGGTPRDTTNVMKLGPVLGQIPGANTGTTNYFPQKVLLYFSPILPPIMQEYLVVCLT